MRPGRAVATVGVTIVAIAVAAAILVVCVLMFGGAPMKNGAAYADGKVTLVVDRLGPIRIAAYIVQLADGSLALVDTGMDPEAGAIRAELSRHGARAGDVRALFLTHAHDDHAGAVRAFPNAEVFALKPAAEALGRGGAVARALGDGERLSVRGTPVEVFALPGHTRGSAAYLIHRVLFLGDAAASISSDALGPNDHGYTADPELNRRSLLALAERLRGRSSEIGLLAFGHQGPIKGLAPLLEWASSVAPGEQGAKRGP
jgi:glyoxylase-like metal-dependent hydrolase (beta-lactamase superfamily II)